MNVLPARMEMADHVSVLSRHRLTLAPRSTCYGQQIDPYELAVGLCQHAGEDHWTVNLVDLKGLIVINGVTTSTSVAARYEFDEQDEPMPTWLQPLVDQVKAHLDSKVRLA